jgi:Holliday junction resolvasome RuvABC ATP-dependent DNA helicase subunit
VAALPAAPTETSALGPRDRVEDLLSSIVGLEHIKSQVRGLRRTAEISDLRESLVPIGRPPRGGGGPMSLVAPALAEDLGRPTASHMVFAGNPGTGKTAVARLLAKVFHELGILRKPKFLEVERMDLVARDKETTAIKTREVIDEARGGVLFIDEANLLGMASKKNRLDTGVDAMVEIIRGIDEAAKNKADDTFPLIILAGFPLEIQAFLAFQPEMRKRFPLVFEFPDYSCSQLARIFMDLAIAKGFELDDDVTESMISQLLEQETTVAWRSERTGRVSEMLLTGVRGEVRKRMRRAQMDEQEDFDPHLLIRSDIENVMRSDFK